MNIHQITTQGTAAQLGPVTVNKVFPMKPGSKNCFMLVEDPSGKSAITIWGPAANTPYTAGMQLTFTASGPKGGLRYTEFPEGSGKFSINANECRVVIGGAPAAPAEPAAVPAFTPGQPWGETASAGIAAAPAHFPQAAPTPVTPVTALHAITLDDRHRMVMDRIIADGMYVFNGVLSAGGPLELAIAMAAPAGPGFPLYWFGEKGI